MHQHFCPRSHRFWTEINTQRKKKKNIPRLLFLQGLGFNKAKITVTIGASEKLSLYFELKYNGKLMYTSKP